MQLNKSEIEQVAKNIVWITNAAIKFTHNEKTIYIDPWKLKHKGKADLILITHDHHDHFSPEDIELITTPETTIVCTADAAAKAQILPHKEIVTVAPFSSFKWNNMEISTIPMYNVVKDNFHNRQKGWVGYIISFNGITMYHAGDTERIPDMKNITCDIALMPIGQTYTMNSVEEAANAILDTRAKIAIPIHFDVHESQPGDPEKLKDLLKGKVEVMIKLPEK